MTDEEEFYAWIDGELDAAAATQVAARVAADPVLSKLAEQHRALGACLRGAFEPVMAGKVAPPRKGAEVIDFGQRRALRRPGFGVPQWAAMAATLAIGLFAGQFVGTPDAPVEARGDMLVATASLDRALDAQLASATTGGPVRVGLTFRGHDGSICRSFTDTGSSGLACRDGDRWRLEGLLAAPRSPQGDYRMAAGEDPRLAALIDERIDGEPFDAAAEKAARDSGWR